MSPLPGSFVSSGSLYSPGRNGKGPGGVYGGVGMCCLPLAPFSQRRERTIAGRTVSSADGVHGTEHHAATPCPTDTAAAEGLAAGGCCTPRGALPLLCSHILVVPVLPGTGDGEEPLAARRAAGATVGAGCTTTAKSGRTEGTCPDTGSGSGDSGTPSHTFVTAQSSVPLPQSLSKPPMGGRCLPHWDRIPGWLWWHRAAPGEPQSLPLLCTMFTFFFGTD